MASGTANSPPRPTHRDSEPRLHSDLFIEQQLARTRLRIKLVDLAMASMVLVGAVILYVLLWVLVDHWVVALTGWGRFFAWSLLLLGIAYYGAAWIVPLLRRRINPSYAARAIEESDPSLKNSLINFLTFRRDRSAAGRLMFRALQQQAAFDLRRVNLDLAVDRTRLIHVGYVVVGLMVLLAAYTIVSPKDVFQSVKRVSVPWADIARPSRVTIEEVRPGDSTAILGSQVEISARIWGLSEQDPVNLYYTTEDRQMVDRAVSMTPMENGRDYQAVIPDDLLGIQQSLHYRIQAGDAISPEYQLQVQRIPSIVVQQIEYEYPEYTRLLQRTTEDGGEIQAIEGTNVKVVAKANHPIRQASILFQRVGTDAPSAPKRMRHDGQTAWFDFRLAWNEYSSYQLVFEPDLGADERGQVDSPPSAVHKIVVTRDLPPEIAILTPSSKEVDVPANGVQRIEVRALDPDYGLTEIALHMQVRDDETKIERFPQEAAGRTGQIVVTYDFRPTKLGFEAGDRVTLWAEATDNCESQVTAQPNTARTPSYTLNILPATPGAGDAASSDSAADDSSSSPQSTPNASSSEDGSAEPQSGDTGQSEQTMPEESAAADSQSEDSSQEPSEQTESGQSEQSEGGDSSSANQGSEDSSGDPQSSAPQPSDQGEQTEGSQTGQGGTQSSGESGTDSGDQDQSGSEGDSSGSSGATSSSDSDTGGDSASSSSQDTSGSDAAQQSSGDNTAGGSMGEGSGGQSGQDQSGSGQQGAREEPLHEGEVFERALEYLREQGGAGETSNQGSSDQQGGSESSDQQDASGNSSQQSPTNDTGDGSQGMDASSDPSTGQQESGSQNGSQQGPRDSTTPSGAGADQTGQQSDAMAQEASSDDTGSEGASTGDNQSSGAAADADRARGEQDAGSSQDKQPGTSDNQAATPADQTAASGQERSGAAGQTTPEGSGSSGADEPAGAPDQTTQGGDPSRTQEAATSEGDPGSSPQQGASNADGAAQGNTPQGNTPQGTNQAAQGADQTTSTPAGSQPSPDGTMTPSPGEPGGEQAAPESGQDGSRSPASSGGGGGPPEGGGLPGDTMESAGGEAREAPAGDAANLEYARQATDLVLEKLQDQQDEPDPELLKKLGWTPEQLRSFLARWQTMKQEAREHEGEAREELQDALRSLGLRPTGPGRRGSRGDNDPMQGLQDTGNPSPPPKDILEQFNAYRKGAARGQRTGG